MKFYFTCNNKTQASALHDVGVKNVFLSYKYVKNLSEYNNWFDSIMVHPGVILDDGYYDWLTKHEGEFNYAIGGDVEYYHQTAKSLGLIPVLRDYLHEISILQKSKLIEDDCMIALGTSNKGKIEEDDWLKKLPQIYQYHGLGKGRWVTKNIDSVDSSTWLSGIRGRKTEVFGGQSLQFGLKGKGYQGLIQSACSRQVK